MPRYDYRCEAGHKYEKIEPFGSPAVHPCERCGKEARRVLVAPPLLFKGSGFYKTSSRSSGSGGDAASNGTSSNRSKTPPKAEAEPAGAASDD